MKSHLVISNTPVGPASFILRVHRGDDPVRAGQCFSVGTADMAINREYSIYSGENDPYLEFFVRRVDDGILTPRLARLQKGDSVYVAGPFGAFCIDEPRRSAPFVFVATGTGVAPFHSFIRSYPALDYRLYWGVRHESDLTVLSDYDEERVRTCVSRSSSQPTEHVTDALAADELSASAFYYLCGNRSMIIDVTKQLRDKGVPGGNIFMETFF
jgi:ferredoxin--NADP+ reductase